MGTHPEKNGAEPGQRWTESDGRGADKDGQRPEREVREAEGIEVVVDPGLYGE